MSAKPNLWKIEERQDPQMVLAAFRCLGEIHERDARLIADIDLCLTDEEAWEPGDLVALLERVRIAIGGRLP